MPGNDGINNPHTLVSATLIGLPLIDRKTGQFSLEAPPAAPDPVKNAKIRKKLADQFQPHAIPLVSVKPAPVPRLISAVGIMDVGQGACAMLIDHQEPVTYYDIGYPVFAYNSSTPVNIRAQAPGGGPIPQNQTANLEVVLSHWDWDHWRLAAIWRLNGLFWTFPFQLLGMSAAKFLKTVTNGAVYNPLNPTIRRASYTICKCNPRSGAPKATLMNNSGLALRVPMRLPSTNANASNNALLMTGDAGFDTLPNYPYAYANLSGIVAVHHGSNAHNAAGNLPPQAPGHDGLIAYSYGILTAGQHCYGFPVATAVARYQAAGWGRVATTNTATTETSTAEGATLNGPGRPLVRGNIRMGDQTQLAAYTKKTAFFHFASVLD